MLNELKRKELEKITVIVLDHFKEKEAEINDLNVFPVPDGDTGTNMLLTLKSIRDELLKLKSFRLKSILEKVSFGALMGARGNSGVILSQIIRGFFEVIIKNDGFNIDILREALKSSRELAYSSVQNPTEGTILTTIKDIHIYVEELTSKKNNIGWVELLDGIIAETEKSVVRTTFLLPVLKQADVVDAGAQGILDILIGARKALTEIKSANGSIGNKITKGKGRKVSGRIKEKDMEKELVGEVPSGPGGPGGKAYRAMSSLEEVKKGFDIKFDYCTELLVKGNGMNIEKLREKIGTYGDSALVVGNQNMIKIHVHTNHPNKVLQRALREGTIHDIQIDNMEDQRNENLKEEEAGIEEKVAKRSLIAVVTGEGLENIFKSIGVDVLVGGGQTMNPSTHDMVKAINSIDDGEVIIFPNNKNIILTAMQAKKIAKGKTVTVVPTKTIPEGIYAVLNYNPASGMEENISNMENSLKKSKSGEITMAVRDAKLHVGKIRKGEFIGLYNGDVRIVSNNIVDATTDLVRDMIEGFEEVVTFYLGDEEKPDDTENIRKKLKEYFPKIDIEIHKGGQPLYPYIFSIE